MSGTVSWFSCHFLIFNFYLLGIFGVRNPQSEVFLPFPGAQRDVRLVMGFISQEPEQRRTLLPLEPAELI